ncbi:MAG: Gfo/Idh/MocA family oxidoreductase [Planctomycetota bacterium]
MLCVGATLPGRFAFQADKSVNNKLRLGIVGTANRGGANLNGVQGEYIAALCDFDSKYLANAAKRFPKATLDVDWRKLIDRVDLDAIVISTPDHLHGPVAAAALRAGKDVYCEKPLTHTVREARLLQEPECETPTRDPNGHPNPRGR